MQAHAGWQVPLSGLRFWILGRTDPEAPVAEYTLDPDLLDELVATAEAGGQAERAEHWRARKSEAEAAEEELERRAKEGAK